MTTTEKTKLFDDGRMYKFRHLQHAFLVRDRVDLQNKQEHFGFPIGRLMTPRDRQWLGKELNDYLATRPTTQAEFRAMYDHPPSKVDIPKKQKAKIAPPATTTKRTAKKSARVEA
jgi:hypothetical protein